MDDLTREQKQLLVSLYKEVVSRKSRMSFEDANYFIDSNIIRDLFLPDASSDHVSDLCWALHKKGYILCFPGDNLANNIELTDETIVYMENRFSNNLQKIFNFLLTLRP